MRLQRGPPKAAPAGPPQKPGGVRGFRLRRDRFGLFSALFGSSVLVGVIKVPGFSLRKCGNTGHGTDEEHAFGFLLNTPHVEEFTMDTLRSGGRGQYSGIPSPLEERHFYWISVKSIFRFDNRHDFRFIGTSDTMSNTTIYWYTGSLLFVTPFGASEEKMSGKKMTARLILMRTRFRASIHIVVISIFQAKKRVVYSNRNRLVRNRIQR